MTVAWIQTNAPTVARAGHRRQRWVGWGLPVGGLLAVGLLGVGGLSRAGWWVGLAAAPPPTMWWADQRDGGGPAAPGWDYAMQSPLFLAGQITAVVIGAGVLGWALSASGLGDRLHPHHEFSTGTPQPTPARG